MSTGWTGAVHKVDKELGNTMKDVKSSDTARYIAEKVTFANPLVFFDDLKKACVKACSLDITPPKESTLNSSFKVLSELLMPKKL